MYYHPVIGSFDRDLRALHYITKMLLHYYRNVTKGVRGSEYKPPNHGKKKFRTRIIIH